MKTSGLGLGRAWQIVAKSCPRLPALRLSLRRSSGSANSDPCVPRQVIGSQLGGIHPGRPVGLAAVVSVRVACLELLCAMMAWEPFR